MELKRVVVTGLGAITPLGNNVKTTWEAMINGESGAGPITLFDPSKFKTRFACEVKNFDPNTYFDRKEARKMDRYAQFALVSAQEAIEDSGLVSVAVNPNKDDIHSFELYMERYKAGLDIEKTAAECLK